MDKIALYGSDSDTDTDTEQRANIEEETNEPSLPPLPDILFDKFHRAPSLPDDMKLNKVIKVPPGYFNSFCSIEIKPTAKQLDAFNDIFTNFNMVTRISSNYKKLKVPKFTPLYQSETFSGVPRELHISLTGNIAFKRQEKELFLGEVKKNLKNLSINRDDLVLTFDKLSILSNFIGTKLFLVLLLSDESRVQYQAISDSILEAVQKANHGEDALTTSDFIMCDPSKSHISVLEGTFQEVHKLTEEEKQLLISEVESIEISKALRFSYNSVKVQCGTSRQSYQIGKKS